MFYGFCKQFNDNVFIENTTKFVNSVLILEK